MQLKNKFVRQQAKMEKCIIRLNEMTHHHESDLALIAKSEEVIKRIQLTNQQSEQRMFKQQSHVDKLEQALSQAIRERSQMARKLMTLEASSGEMSKKLNTLEASASARHIGVEDIKMLQELHA